MLTLAQVINRLIVNVSDIDVPISRKCTKPAVERILEFGRELYSMSQRLDNQSERITNNQKMLEVRPFMFYLHVFFHVLKVFL